MQRTVTGTSSKQQPLPKNRRKFDSFNHLVVAVLFTYSLLIGVAPAMSVVSNPNDLAECTINVFQEIAKTNAWSGRTKGCAIGKVVVAKRGSGVFVTTWELVKSGGNWEKLALSAAAGYHELVDKKLLKNVINDIKNRTGRLKNCLDSIEERNDPGECRDKAKKVYSAGDVIGVDMERIIWFDDDGRHVVLGFSYGNSAASDTAPAELEQTTGLPSRIQIDLHPEQASSGSNAAAQTGVSQPLAPKKSQPVSR